MIVKNEAVSIKKTLESAKPFIDRYLVLDTGSTDGTQRIVLDTMADFPGHLVEAPFISVAETREWEGFENFIDFAITRNKALDLDAKHNGAEFQLFLSGDEYLKNGAKLREHLEKFVTEDVVKLSCNYEGPANKVDAHFLRVHIDSTMLFSPRVLRTGSDWHYEEIVHEVPCNRVQTNAPVAGILDAEIEHVVSNPEARFEAIEARHIPLLTRLLQDEPENPRALFFLAQSYRTLTEFMSANEKLSYALEAMGLYIRRSALPFTTDAERRAVEFCYLDIAQLTGVYTGEEMYARVAKLCAEDPNRPEPALLLATIASKKGSILTVYELAARAATIAAGAKAAIDDSSPVEKSCEWRAHQLAAVAAKQLAARFPEKYGAEYGPLIQKHVDAGLAAGGAWMDFQGLIAPEDGSSGVPMSSFEMPTEVTT